jgi:hypothetical protein
VEYNKEVLTPQYILISVFVHHHAYYKSLSALSSRIKDNNSFWESMILAYRELAVIEWCKVFGSRKENLHWTKTPIGKTAEQAREDFRCRLLSKTGFNQEQWEIYHRDMLIFRDKFVAHLDMNGVMQVGLQDLDPALQVAYVYEEWAKAIEPALRERDSLRSRHEEWKAEASLVVAPLSHP